MAANDYHVIVYQILAYLPIRPSENGGSFNRELKKMADQGTIRYAPPVIEILNKDTLHNILA